MTESKFEQLYEVAAIGYKEAVERKSRRDMLHWKKRLAWLNRMLAEAGK